MAAARSATPYSASTAYHAARTTDVLNFHRPRSYGDRINPDRLQPFDIQGAIALAREIAVFVLDSARHGRLSSPRATLLGARPRSLDPG